MSTNASDGAATPSNPWKQAQGRAEAELAITKATLKQQKLLSTSQLQLLKTQQELIAGLVPAIKESGIEGTINADAAAGYPARLVASQALGDVGTQVASVLCGPRAPGGIQPLPSDARVLIVEDLSSVPSPVAARELRRQLDALEALAATQRREVKDALKQLDLDENIPKVAGAPLATAALALPLLTEAISTAGSLASYLRADVELKGETFSLGHDQLAAIVSGALAPCVASVTLAGFLGANTLPSAAPPSPPEIPARDQKALDDQMAAVEKSLAELKVRREQLNATLLEPEASTIKAIAERIAALQEQIDSLHPVDHEVQIAAKRAEIEKLLRDLAMPQQRWKRIARHVAGVDALLREYEAFKSGLVATPEGGKRSRLAEALLAERLERLAFTHVLSLKVYSSGGQVITRRRFFGGDASFVGGVAIGYVLTDMAGTVLASGSTGGLSALDFRPDTVSTPPNQIRRLFGPA
jgi:hypothetical protein